MKELVKYMVALLNIKTDSDFVILDMTSEMQGVTDLADYRNFMRENRNYLGMDFYTGFNKFIELTKIYKEKYARENNVERLENGSKVARELADKVKAISMLVEDKGLGFKNFQPNGKPFTAFDMAQLKKVGSLSRCVTLQKSISGGDALFEKLNEQMHKIVINKALGYTKPEKTNNSVSALLSTAVKNTKITA